MLTRIIVFMLAALASAAVIAPAFADDPAKRKITVVFDHALPNVPGKSMKGILVEYGPGGSSRSHKHPASAFIYATVLEGANRSQVNDGPVKVYRVGENWMEKPGDHHRVSANASDSQPAKLLAVFVVDTADKNIVIDDPH
jgi:quercetin dioxygenase-like cupin family protein